MTAIIVAALQILLLLLRAHFSRDSDHDKAMEAIREAQSKLAHLGTDFEMKIRYSAPPKADVDRVQDSMDEERNGNASSHN